MKRDIVLKRVLPVWTLLLGFAASGCLLVRTSENRISLNDDGSGEAVLRLIDIRSDAVTDSGVTEDFHAMINDFDKSVVEEFERDGRAISSKHFTVHGDTLIAIITYKFKALSSFEGLRVTGDEMFFVIDAGREVVHTNGKVRNGERGTLEIAWDRAERYLVYEVREKELPPSVALGKRYLAYMKK